MKIIFGLMAALILGGCSGMAAVSVGETTYSTGIYLDKEVEHYE